MSRLLNFIKPQPYNPKGTTDHDGLTGSQLYEDPVDAARKLGALRVEQKYWDRHAPFECEVTFTNDRGSRIHARGLHHDFYTAIAMAVDEARRLK